MDPPAPPEAHRPEQLREAVARYVTALHRSYRAQARLLSPALQGSLPLMSAEQFQVLAAGAGSLHIIATRQPLPPRQDPEVEIQDELAPLRWSLRFYDPVVLPELGLIDEGRAAMSEEVRRVLGVRTWLYHLVVQPGAQLGEHHAAHAGTALAHTHSAAARDFEAMRYRAQGRERLVMEMEGAAQVGLGRAQALLARAIVPGDAQVAALAGQADTDPVELRRAVLRALSEYPS